MITYDCLKCHHLVFSKFIIENNFALSDIFTGIENYFSLQIFCLFIFLSKEIQIICYHRKSMCEKFQILYVIRIVHCCLDLVFHSLTIHTFVAFPHLVWILGATPHSHSPVSRFLPLSPRYSFFLVLSVPLLCSFHAPFSVCFSLL